MSYWWKFLFRYTRSSVLALNGGDKKRSGSRDRATLSARGYFAFILSEIDGTPIVSTFLYRTIRTCPFHKSRSSTRYHYTPNLFQRERCWNVTIYPAFSLFLFLLTRDQVSSPRKNKILEKKNSLRRDSILVLRSNFWNEIYTRRPHTQTKKKHSLSTLLKRRLVCIFSREFLKNSPHPLHSNHHPACIKPSLDGPEAIRLISIESSVQADSSRRFRFDRSRAIWTRARLPAASQTMHLLRDRLPRECLNNDRGVEKGIVDRQKLVEANW